MNIKQEIFGLYQGEEVLLFTLENQHGMQVKAMNYGATITKICIPDKNDQLLSVACGFDSFDEYFSEEYKNNAPYFGGTIGRYCSQIKDARFSIEGTEYRLAANCGTNNLHGGNVGFDKKLWKGTPLPDQNAIRFELFSPDMEEGFPGNLHARVTLKLSDNNEIIIHYEADCDKTCPVAMTNHSYFNLNGFKKTVENFVVKINTPLLQELDETGAGTGKIKNVNGTIEDLREGKTVAQVQEALGDGFEHFYIFNNPAGELLQTALISDPESGRSLEVLTTEPCMLFYTAKYMSNALQRNPEEKYGKFMAFACETHRWQNGPNIPNSPRTFLNPGEKFDSTTIFRINF